MKYFGPPSDKCLLVVGGYGDTLETFEPFLTALSKGFNDHQLCAVDLAQDSDSNVLELQAEELQNVVSQLNQHPRFTAITIWCTSMGSYSVIKLLIKPTLLNKIIKVILFDPADYLVSATSDTTWSGYQNFAPTSAVISDHLTAISGHIIIDVVHLTLKNHGPDGYLDQDYLRRGHSHTGGYPRLNSKMVKGFWDKIPQQNRGQYLEVDGIPHGFIRDGQIEQNFTQIAHLTNSLLSPKP